MMATRPMKSMVPTKLPKLLIWLPKRIQPPAAVTASHTTESASATQVGVEEERFCRL